MILGERDDFADARRNEDSLPQTVFRRTEDATNFCVQLANIDSVCFEVFKDLRVAFFEQREHQVLGTNVILIVVAALLLCCTQHAP